MVTFGIWRRSNPANAGSGSGSGGGASLNDGVAPFRFPTPPPPPPPSAADTWPPLLPLLLPRGDAIAVVVAAVGGPRGEEDVRRVGLAMATVAWPSSSRLMCAA